jgi:hypothetical protein
MVRGKIILLMKKIEKYFPVLNLKSRNRFFVKFLLWLLSLNYMIIFEPSAHRQQVGLGGPPVKRSDCTEIA